MKKVITLVVVLLAVLIIAAGIYGAIYTWEWVVAYNLETERWLIEKYGTLETTSWHPTRMYMIPFGCLVLSIAVACGVLKLRIKTIGHVLFILKGRGNKS